MHKYTNTQMHKYTNTKFEAGQIIPALTKLNASALLFAAVRVCTSFSLQYIPLRRTDHIRIQDWLTVLQHRHKFKNIQMQAHKYRSTREDRQYQGDWLARVGLSAADLCLLQHHYCRTDLTQCVEKWHIVHTHVDYLHICFVCCCMVVYFPVCAS